MLLNVNEQKVYISCLDLNPDVELVDKIFSKDRVREFIKKIPEGTQVRPIAQRILLKKEYFLEQDSNIPIVNNINNINNKLPALAEFNDELYRDVVSLMNMKENTEKVEEMSKEIKKYKLENQQLSNKVIMILTGLILSLIINLLFILVF